MTRKKRFNELLLNHSFIKEFPDKLQQTIEEKLPTDHGDFKAFKIRLRNRNACMLILETEIIIFWTTQFWWLKFPKVQVIDLNEINRIKSINSEGLFIHASKHPDIIDENYQAGEFWFMSMQERNRVVEFIRNRSVRLEHI